MQLDRALAEMEKRPDGRVDQAIRRLSARESDARAAVSRAESSLAAGPPTETRRLILQADREYGGLIGAALIALADRCSCGVFDEPGGPHR